MRAKFSWRQAFVGGAVGVFVGVLAFQLFGVLGVFVIPLIVGTMSGWSENPGGGGGVSGGGEGGGCGGVNVAPL